MKPKSPHTLKISADALSPSLPEISDYALSDFGDFKPAPAPRPVRKDDMFLSEPEFITPSFADSFPLSWFGDAPLQEDD